ncbi:MAG: hypothetical protein A4E63_01761 [Syntrophorhabdus sp. PtaU1.Bin050]|nr:MAG: hypothetical protein A4E63_01761 [Syntrophorhabdus sp. PtaU1.Bin050]
MPGHAKCKKGCGRSGQCRGYCYSCFHEEYGITYEAYRKHVLFRGEDPREVARRIRKADLQQSDERVQKAKEEFEKAMEEEREIETAPQTDQPVPLFQIFLDPELLDALTKKAKAEYRTPELHAAYLIDKGVRGGQ